MKWSLNINQQQAIVLGLKNTTEAIIFGMICDVATWAEPVVLDGEVYYWASRSRFVYDLPLLGLKNDTVYRYFRSLEKLGLIVHKKEGAKDCIKLTELGKSYYVGKKSDCTENSERNPSNLGKKSENHSENSPTYPSTISHPSMNHPHHQEEEEDGTVITELVLDPYSLLPEEGIDGMGKEQIVEGIERLVAANAGDEQRYRETLIREILSGGGRTLGNIRRKLTPRHGTCRTGSNRVPVLPAGIDAFDLYETGGVA